MRNMTILKSEKYVLKKLIFDFIDETFSLKCNFFKLWSQKHGPEIPTTLESSLKSKFLSITFVAEATKYKTHFRTEYQLTFINHVSTVFAK